MSNRIAIVPSPARIQSKDLVVQNLEDELLIYNLKTHQAICLNQTAALVWQNCDGESKISEIAGKLKKKLGAPVSEELVSFALRELNEKGLIENGEGVSDRFEGLSRREIVRKIGFASMVALPIVSSIVSPKAAAALSTRILVMVDPDPDASTPAPPTPTPTPCLERQEFISVSLCFRRRGECAREGYNNEWCHRTYGRIARARCCSMRTVGLILVGDNLRTENFVCSCA